jgi:hypothetical protein
LQVPYRVVLGTGTGKHQSRAAFLRDRPRKAQRDIHPIEVRGVAPKLAGDFAPSQVDRHIGANFPDDCANAWFVAHIELQEMHIARL